MTVLRRLLEFEELPADRSWLIWRKLDAEATAVAVASSRTQHRLDVAENPSADADALARLAHDAEPRVRFVYAVLLREFGRRIPAGVAEVLAGDKDPRVRRMIGGCEGLSPEVQDLLVSDEDPAVRAAVLSRDLWRRLAEPVRRRLLDDPAPRVRERIAELSRAEAEPMALTAQARVAHADATIRREAAGDPQVPFVLARRLANDPENTVRLALSMREDLTEEQRAAIAVEVPDSDWVPRPRWIQERATDPRTALRIAESRHVGLRRALAMQPHLPPEVVARLAADKDPWVRRDLCDHCQDAPHELLVEIYATAEDRGWSALRYHPNFARPGLARFWDHPNHRLRLAALDDPQAGPELPSRLADDPEVGVWAVRDPRLPPDELLRRLTLPGSAFAAAANPALPSAWMHQLIDLATDR
ncbi:hypothetical protein WN71_007815 [Streptomyces mangrovisoli]|uniref:LRV domain-containing protein n=1 Tax=Streptomyces mangrovisoli TaxID=1428628 RepID=A0A1J4P0R7_9ACTN|nr:hypothetical protein WN71_007815 [Streptomyces mangrovisoli]